MDLMKDNLLTTAITAGAGILALWYYGHEQRMEDQKKLDALMARARVLEETVEKLTKTVQALREKTLTADDSDAQLKTLNASLLGLGEASVKIGTRDSELAMWQAKHVNAIVKDAYKIKTAIVGMKTLGDLDLKSSLSSFSNKGVFTKELDAALLLGEVDIAVHSMKDLPTTLEEGLALCAVLERGSIEDAVVLNSTLKEEGKVKSLDDLPKGAVIGTSALRRRAILSKHYPHLNVKDVRGNLQTRFKKLDSKQYDALVLARTGLERLKMHDRIDQILDSSKFGYAVSQGALAVVCRSTDKRMMSLFLPLNHVPTRLRTTAERALLRSLEGGCKVPIAVKTDYDSAKQTMTMQGWVVSLDGQKVCHATVTDAPVPLSLEKGLEAAKAVGLTVAEALRKEGAEAILAACRGDNMGHTPPPSKTK
mmetsp:Transcript_19252/g.37317  ORF Transcript_19252/g.37317 Transcript_19252/m.37317 type:complete len:423 (+) Transcript_19252:45-1313(+)